MTGEWALPQLEQITALTHNPSGLPQQSKDPQIEALEGEIQYQNELRNQQEFAYGKAIAQAGRSPLPDERQLHYLFDTQPTKEDIDNKSEWDESTIDETNVLRHIQFGMYEPSEKMALLREYADIQILRQQIGKEHVAMNAAKRLYLNILASKGTIREGHTPAIEIMLNPSNRVEVTQKTQPYDTTRQPAGFLGFLKGR